MEALWRWTSPSVFLVLALNIGCIRSQNVGPKYPFPIQEELLRDSNPGLLSTQLQKDRLTIYPKNENALSGLIAPNSILEFQSPFLKDGLYPQNISPNLMNVPFNPFAYQSRLMSIFQSQGQRLLGPLSSLSQQNLGLSPLETLSPELLQGTIPSPTLLSNQQIHTANLGLAQNPSPCQQRDSRSLSKCLSSQDFNPLIPNVPPAGIDLPPPPGIAPLASPVHVAFAPLLPLINQGLLGASNEIVPLGSAQSFSVLNNPQVNNLGDILSETQACNIADAQYPFTATLPLPNSPSNMFRLPRPTLFPLITPIQSPVTSPLESIDNYQQIITPNQVPVIVDTEIVIKEPSQPITPSVPQTINDLLSNSLSFIPPISYSNYNAPNPNSQINVLPSQNTVALPPVYEPPPINTDVCDTQSQSADTVPINLQINLPAPTVPAPRITIISTAIPTESTSNSAGDASFDMYSMPPVIIENPRKRSWLPLVLVTLLAGGGNYGNGCCDSGPTPIPYPIPIPTNSPVIMNK